MDETSQIQPPPSFVEIYASRSGKLLIGKPELVARYELCEDLATHLVEQAQTLYHVQAPSEFEVLRTARSLRPSPLKSANTTA